MAVNGEMWWYSCHSLRPHWNSVCVCIFLVTFYERGQVWQHFDQKSFSSAEYFGCAGDLFGKFLLFKNYLSHSSLHSKRGFPAKNRAKHTGCRRRLWQNRNTKSNTVWTRKTSTVSCPLWSFVDVPGQKYARGIWRQSLGFFLFSPIESQWGFLTSFFANHVAIVTRIGKKSNSTPIPAEPLVLMYILRGLCKPCGSFCEPKFVGTLLRLLLWSMAEPNKCFAIAWQAH